MRKSSLFLIMLVGLFLTRQSAMGALDHYWTFDTDVTDAVVGGLDGTIVGTGVSISNVAGEFQRGTGALKIVPTGSGDYVNIGSPAIPIYSPMAYTIASWFKLDKTLGVAPTDGRNCIWETTPYWTSSMEVKQANNDTITWSMQGTPWIIQNNQSPSVDDGQWHHVALVYDSPAGTVDYYFDGTQYGDSVVANDLTQPTTGLNIGVHRYAGGNRNWQGYVDDFAIFNGTIDAAGISGLYAGTYTPETVPVTDGPDSPTPTGPIPTAPLAAYWTFDSDYTSEVHNDYFEGTPKGGEYTSITHVAGEFHEGSGALKLDSGSSSGNGTFVEIPREVAMADRDHQITISAWFKPTDISGDGSDERNALWESKPGFQLSCSIGVEDDLEWACDGIRMDLDGPAVNMNQWNHVVMMLDLDAELIRFYHNGVLIDEEPTWGYEIAEMAGFNIGSHRTGDGTRDFDGFIDDVAVYHGVLSPLAVAGLYDGTYTPETVPVSSGALPWLPGDATRDGIVDAEDAAVLAANWLTQAEEVTWMMGDFNGDGAVNDIDATMMAANWGETLPVSSAAVPEPGVTAMLLATLLAAACGLRYRR